MVSGVGGVYRQPGAFRQHNKHRSNVVMSSSRLQASDAEYIVVIVVCIKLFLPGSAVNYKLLIFSIVRYLVDGAEANNINNIVGKVSSYSE